MNDDDLSLRTETTAPAPHQGDVANLTDPELVTHISRQSHAALAEVYNRYGGPTHGLAAQLCGTDADDIVQDTFLLLWHRPDRFDASRGSLRSFLMKQIRCRAFDPLHGSGSRRASKTAIRAEHSGLGAEDGALARLAGERSWSLLSRLNKGQRSAIALAYFGGHTYQEVAILLAVPEDTVKSRIRQGLTQLRQHIEFDNVDRVGPGGRGQR